MQKRRQLLFPFTLCFGLCLVIFLISQTGIGKGVVGTIEQILLTPWTIASSPLNQQNNDPSLQTLIDVKKCSSLEKDNKALNDQFQTTTVSSTHLIPAYVIAAPSFIPGISAPDHIILNRGARDGVRVGQAALYKDNLIGKVIKTSNYLSEVMLVSHPSFSITVRTLSTGALGVIRGQGNGQLLLDNVVLSDTLSVPDTVTVYGEADTEGVHAQAGLLIGKIVSVDKKPSALFQRARVKQIIDVSKLAMVFVQN